MMRLTANGKHELKKISVTILGMRIVAKLVAQLEINVVIDQIRLNMNKYFFLFTLSAR